MGVTPPDACGTLQSVLKWFRERDKRRRQRKEAHVVKLGRKIERLNDVLRGIELDMWPDDYAEIERDRQAAAIEKYNLEVELAKERR